MTASEPVRISSIPECEDLPSVRALLEVQVDMQVADLAVMLRLPVPEIDAETALNLAAANQIFNLIAGASVLLRDADFDGLHERKSDRGPRFMEAVREHLPLNHPMDLTAPGKAAHIMWSLTRNPLVHAFGIGKNDLSFPGLPRSERDPAVYISKPKIGLTPAEVRELLRGEEPRPDWLTAPIITEMSQPADSVTINVVPLAWGAVALIRDVLRTPQHRDRAEDVARRLLTPPAQ